MAQDVLPNFSAKSASRKATGYLALNCGQAFVVDAPKLVGNRWEIPVWAVHDDYGRIAQIGIIPVDADSGDILLTDSDRAKIKSDGRDAIRQAIENSNTKS